MDKAIKKAQEIAVEITKTPVEVPDATLDELEGIDMSAFAYQEEPEGSNVWRIADDSCADWAVRKISEERAELARLKALADEQIDSIMAKVAAAEKRCENGTRFLIGKLEEYFETVPHKTTKTQHTYRLLSGTLKKKLGGVSMKQDDAKLVEYLKATGRTDMIQTTEKPKWGEYKKRLEIIGGAVVDTDTGEIVEAVGVVEKPDTFTVDV